MNRPRLSLLLRGANQSFSAQYGARAQHRPLTLPQAAVLRAVADFDAGCCMTQTEIVAAAKVDRSSLTNLIATLRQRGLVTIERSGAAKLISLTTAGRTALAAAESDITLAEKILIQRVPRAWREAFIGGLKAVAR